MRQTKIKSRGVLFTQPQGEWDLNMYLITGNKYNYVIDTGLGSSSTAPVLDYIGGSTKPTIVINTHYHWDHIWGNDTFKDSLLVSHKLCREMIQANWDEMLHKYRQYCYGDVRKKLPDLLFEQEMYFPEDRIRLFYSPGHTLDSISILDEADKVLLLGDNIGDSPEELLPSLNCSHKIYKATLRKYETMDFDTCISGHNQVFDKTILSKLFDML